MNYYYFINFDQRLTKYFLNSNGCVSSSRFRFIDCRDNFHGSIPSYFLTYYTYYNIEEFQKSLKIEVENLWKYPICGFLSSKSDIYKIPVYMQRWRDIFSIDFHQPCYKQSYGSYIYIYITLTVTYSMLNRTPPNILVQTVYV